MTIEIRDEHTADLVRLLAEHTGTDQETAIAQAVQAKLDFLGVGYSSYRERRNARVRARALEVQRDAAASASPEEQLA